MPKDERAPAYQDASQTRREFIRSVLLTTTYAAPAVATFTVADLAAGAPKKNGMMGASSGRMKTKRKKGKPKKTGM